MTTTIRRLILLFAVAGLGCSVAAAWVHARIVADPTYVSPCDINATFNCSQVYLSDYGSIGGVSVALIGVGWFALVTWLAAARPAPGASGQPTDYIFPLALIGLAVVLYLGYASFFVLRTACLLCLGTYACVLGIAAASARSRKVSVGDLPGRLVGDLGAATRRPATIVVLLAGVAALAGSIAWFPKEGQARAAAPVGSSAEQEFAKTWEAQPRIDFGPPAAGAKATLFKFNDWLCPTCKLMHTAYQPTLDLFAREAPGQVSYVVKDFPLSNRCNPGVGQTVGGHEAACEAAAAVRIARAHQKEKEMVDWIFAEQSRLITLSMKGPGAVDAIKAKVAELTGVKNFDAEYTRLLPAIRQDGADGVALQVRFTPTFYLSGVRTTSEGGDNLPAQYLEMAIRLELKRAAVK